MAVNRCALAACIILIGDPDCVFTTSRRVDEKCTSPETSFIVIEHCQLRLDYEYERISKFALNINGWESSVRSVPGQHARERSSSPRESSFNEKHASMQKNAWIRPICRRPCREVRKTGIKIPRCYNYRYYIACKRCEVSRCILANVNSSSCSLYVIVRPSVCRLSVTFVRPTQTIEIFSNVSTP